MLDSTSYKEYYTVASRAKPPKEKSKYKKKVDEPVTLSKSKSSPAAKGARLKTPAKVTQSDSTSYKEYYTVASRAKPPKEKSKYKKKVDEPVTLSKSKSSPAAKGARLKTPAKVTQSGKKRQFASVPKAKGLVVGKR
nr:hypothetical protein [Tanacetum cinerariifolium]